ncbi:oxidoreductase [Viridothelium virens]|uniref:Oxidoreductase n=1 Tax=Viridothelium virens TaxID=1048519 RepID=A0A6A6HBA4_VIRVR|nr:oxidoreductase [Viridothelium virens]
MAYSMEGVGLITGAASGIGRATTLALARDGCKRLVLADVNASGLESLSSELKSANSTMQIVCVPTDTSKEIDVQHMVDEAVKAFGSIHYCVNSAGVTSSPRTVSHELPIEAWDRVQRINLRGVWLCQKAEITQMLKQQAELTMMTGAPPQRGSIVNISSVLGRVAHPTNGSYAAAKAGVLGISRTDAVAYGNEGIRINSVCPGIIETPMVENSLREGANYDKLIERVPISRWGRPEEVAQVCVFLASARASFVTGEEVIVDGGLLHKL